MAQGLESGFTSAEILAMQKDAVRRVNEMQRIAQEKLKSSSAVLEANHTAAETVDSTLPLTSLLNNLSEAAANQNSSLPPQAVTNDFAANFTADISSESPQSDSSNMQGDTILTYHDDSGNTYNPQHDQINACCPQNSPTGAFAGILQKLNLDEEKIIIILLLILLVNEGADSMLILALVYILL